MKQSVLFAILVCMIMLLAFMPQIASAQIATHAVLSEVYGGGGNSGATYTNDFIELYNPTSTAIDVTGWSVQYASAAGTSWQVTNLSGTIPAHGFYLVQEAQGAGGSVPLPTPDAIGAIAMSGTNGKVALVNTTTALVGTDPHADPTVVDFLGFGTANGYEGHPTVSLSNTTSAERKAKFNSTVDSMMVAGADSLTGNGWETNDNSADFVIRPRQNPQNTAAPLEVPPTIGNIAPIIAGESRALFVAEVSGTDSVYASVSDLDGTVSSVKLHIKVNGGTIDSSIVMVVTTAPQYAGVIPAAKHTTAGNLVEYFITAIDNGGAYSVGTTKGYFVGDAPIGTVKANTLANINGYAARFNGTLNVNSNTYTNGQGFMQDATAGIQLFKAGGMPALSAGRNVKVQGSVIPFAGGFELTDPSFAVVDTNLGTSTLTPLAITLPTTQTPNYANEGRLVQISGVTTLSTGNFAASTGYLYQEADTDTITIRVESNGTANNLVGLPILATPVNAIGILSYQNGYQRLKPRSSADMGYSGGDGTGTATIAPTFRFTGAAAVVETLTVAGDGVNTLEGVSVTIPSTWTWSGTPILSGTGFGSASASVSGTGTSVDPWIITVSGGAVTNVNTGIIRFTGLTAPGTTGLTIWTTKTRITGGTLNNIAVHPTVNVVSGFEAVASGNWSNPATWSSNAVPTSTDNVTLTTLGTVVTIDVANAQCNNLTLTGSGSASNSGPVLQFAATGASQLTINGNLAISGGSGGGSGDRGGRAQLTSNGNTSAVLIAKHNVQSGSSNTTGNGNAGLNMNEGTVKLNGATSDTLIIGAGFRLGNLEIGDGITAKTVSTALNVTSSTMTVRSLTVKSGSTFKIGASVNSNSFSIGNIGNAGIPLLNGGITVESGATLSALDSVSTSSFINLFGGGITNNGAINLVNAVSGRAYGMRIDSTSQTIGGTNAATLGNVTLGANQTLTLNQRVNVGAGFAMTVNGTLAETAGHTVFGTATTTRTVAASSTETFGGIGLELVTSATAPGSTVVTRVTGVASVGGSSSSILRYFDIVPTTNAGLAATLRYFYDDTELAGQTAATLQLWRSEDAGSTWAAAGGTVNTTLHSIQLAGVDSLSRWTASDASHPLSGGSTLNLNIALLAGWNLISNPLTNPIPGDSVRQMYPTALNAYAFEFAGGYVQRYRLANGKGYWEKFPAAISQQITGTARTRDSITVAAGWNMVGSISNPVDTSTIVSVPPGLKSSNWFRYAGGYTIETQLQPGKGYWIKSTGAGKFVLANPLAAAPKTSGGVNVADMLNSITITDAQGNAQTLYFGADANHAIPVEFYGVPPAPPAGAFDARFEAADGGSMVMTHAAKVSEPVEYTIAIQSEAYPLTVSWNVTNGTAAYALADGMNGKAFATKDIAGQGSMKVANSGVAKLNLKLVGDGTLPVDFALNQNYPNPFNPTTSIRYALPVESKLTMDVFNVLGQRVRTLVNDNVAAGYHAIEWNGTNNAGQQLASGVYFVQMSAKGANGKTFSDVRKLMMLK